MEKEELKNISKLFIDYDGDVQVNPFAKVHWGMIKDSLKEGKLYIDDNKNFGVILSEAKSNRTIRDFSREIVGNIKKGDIIIKRLFYKNGYRDHVLNYISTIGFSTRIDIILSLVLLTTSSTPFNVRISFLYYSMRNIITIC